MGSNIESLLSRLMTYDPEKVVLFGSRARNTSDSYSDVDLLIVKKTEKRFLDRIKEVIHILRPNFAIDILVYTPEEFEVMLSEDNPFLKHVLEDGKVIYEKQSCRSQKMA